MPRWLSSIPRRTLRTSAPRRFSIPSLARPNSVAGLKRLRTSPLSFRKALGRIDIQARCCGQKRSPRSRGTRLAYLPVRRNAGLSRLRLQASAQNGYDTLDLRTQNLSHPATRCGLSLSSIRFHRPQMSRSPKVWLVRTLKRLRLLADIRINTMYLRPSIIVGTRRTGPERRYLSLRIDGIPGRLLWNQLHISGPW